MAVSITLYSVNCDPHTLDKSNYVTASAAISGTIRGELDVLQPVIEFTGDVSGYNYAYIAETGRYYHIIGCNRERTGLCVVTMHVDVLWTYAAQILNLPAVVDRSYRLVNSYLPDSMQRTYQYTQCVNKAIGDPLDYIVEVGGTPYTAHIIVTVG